MSIYQKATLVQIPSGYKAADDKLYSVVPNNGDGDFTVSVDADATRVNKDGLIESVVADQARLNYDPTNPQDPHLLLEPSRTNIYTYSQDLNQGTSLVNTSVDNDNTTSPDGSLTGNKLTQTSGSFTRKFLSALSGAYTWSFFVKKGDLRYLNARSLFVLNGTTPANGNTIIDLDTNTIAYKGTNVTSASVIEYPNDWIKVEIVATDNATGSGDIVDFFFTDSDTSTQSTGPAGNGFIWGVQFESGSYGTSYIPNLSSGSTTRTVDFASGAGDANLFNDSEGTLFVEVAALDNDGTYRIINISDGTTANRVLVQLGNDNNRIRVDVVATTTQASFSTTSYNFTEYNKIAIKYKDNDTALFINGAQIGSTITGITSPTGLDRIDFQNGNLGSFFYFRGKLKQLMYFDTALSNSELQTLTS